MFRACPWLVALAILALAALLLGLNGYLLLLTLCLVAAAALLAFSYNEAACAIWPVVTGCTLEMWLGDLLGPDAYQPIIAVVKTAGLLLALLAGVRFGPRLDPFNPAFAYAFMFASGLIHGLHPGLTMADSIRSLAGSAAPFAFSFSRLSRRWTDQIIRITAWTPLIDVALGAAFGALGIRPLFIDSGGARLAALSHPAFLAGFALAGVYASLIELFRTGANRWLALLLANLAILLLTGARAPATYGLAVLALTLAFASSSNFPRSHRLGLVLGLAACVPAVLLLAGDLTGLRLFNAVSNYAGDLSGRDELWPAFEKAAAASPWFGWGLGAGNTIIPPTSQLAETLHTWAAHNEYLRMEVEGGQIGRAILILVFALWCWRNSAPLHSSDRVIIRLVFIAFACHAVTDNVLISTSASVLFTFISAVFARGRLEAESYLAPAPVRTFA
jgi:O-antigen ligase